MSVTVNGDPGDASRARRALAITSVEPPAAPDVRRRRAGERWVHLYGLGPRWYVAVRDGNGVAQGWQWPADLGTSYTYARDVASAVWRHLRHLAVAEPDRWHAPPPTRQPDAEATGEEALPDAHRHGAGQPGARPAGDPPA